MRFKTLVLICIFVIMLGIVTVAKGSSGIDHRDIFVGASARAVGMGSAFTAGPSANNGFLWNPSSLGFMNGIEVNMGGIPFTDESSGPDQAFSLAASPYTLGITDRNVGNLSVASWFNGWNNSNGESTQIVLFGYGLALGEQASAGANLRYYQNNTSIRTNYLWSFDVGAQFTYPLEEAGDSLTIGMNLSELSNGIRENGVLVEGLPLAARFGTTYRPDVATLLSADIVIRGQNDVDWGDRLRLHFGAERWLFNNHFGVRLGYTALTSSDGFSKGQWTQGISFRNNSGQLDYAHVRGGEFDESLHWITATLRWGGKERQPVTTKKSKPSTPKSDTADKQSNDSETVPAPRIKMPTTLDADVEAKGSGEGLQLSESAISPNGDGVADNTTFRFRVRTNETWKLILKDAYTEIVWEKTGTGSPQSGVVWDGKGKTDTLVSDGDYVAQLYVVDGKSTPHLRNSKKVTVDLIPATIEISKKTPSSVGVKIFDINDIAGWELEIYDSGNNLMENSEGKGSPPETITLTKVPQLNATTYRFVLRVTDVAGNGSTQQAQLQFGSGTTENITPKVNETTKLTLMVGSFGERRNADLLAENLQQLHPNEKVKIYTVVVNDRTMHRVTIGEFAVREDATTLKQQIKESQGVDPILITP